MAVKQRWFYPADLFFLACVVLAVMAASAGGALGYLIGLVTVGVGLIVSILQRILVAVRQSAPIRVERGQTAGSTSRAGTHLGAVAGSAEATVRPGAGQAGAAAAMRGAAQHDGQLPR